MQALKLMAVMLAAALLSGCSQSRQIESIAFAVILGADITSEENIELTVQMPSAGGGSKSEEEAEKTAASGYLTASARGATFTDALMALEIAVPRDLSLTQVKLLVVSEDLARSEKFYNFIESLAKLDQTCSSAYFAICQGSAKEFVRHQTPVIGMRVSLGIIAMIEHHRTRGYITGTKFADFYYEGVSVFSDPTAILCATMQEGAAEPLEENSLDGMSPENVPAESSNKNEYIGAAVFRRGRLAGTLDGQETSLVNALRGSAIFFAYNLDGMPVSLQAHGTDGLNIYEDERGVTQIEFALRFNVVANLKVMDTQKLRQTLEQDLIKLLERCQSMGVEPFGFADHAATRFTTLAQWQAYNWRERFSGAEFKIEIDITASEA